jgi:hypothetical protein
MPGLGPLARTRPVNGSAGFGQLTALSQRTCSPRCRVWAVHLAVVGPHSIRAGRRDGARTKRANSPAKWRAASHAALLPRLRGIPRQRSQARHSCRVSGATRVPLRSNSIDPTRAHKTCWARPAVGDVDSIPGSSSPRKRPSATNRRTARLAIGAVARRARAPRRAPPHRSTDSGRSPPIRRA